MVYHIFKKGVVITSIMALLLTACAAHDGGSLAASNRDVVYRDRLVGTWTQKDVGPEATLERTITFLADGSYHSDAVLTKQSGVIKYQNRGSWRLENDSLYITVLKSSRADIPLGSEAPNKILVLTEKEAVTESAGGIRTTAYRKMG